MYRILKFFLITNLSVCIFNNLPAQEEPLKIKRINSTVTFDGNPFEDEWQGLTLFTLVMHRPNYGNEPSEKSEVFIGYDDEYLWIGARLYMHDASKIFTSSKRRDEMLYGVDALGIVIDSYNDNENALAFYTTPTGLRCDYAISNDASGVRGGNMAGFSQIINYSWNTFWDVKTSRDGRGWYAEMRIPFSSLRFKPENNISEMGLIITRNVSANDETDTYPAIDPKYGFMAIYKPSLAATIAFEGVKPYRPVYFSPYVIGGITNDYSLNEAETGYLKDGKTTFNGGVDLKYSINSNLTLDLTANTDFAQVEADDQQVNLTRYSLFFPEKRMFFQERSGIFSFSLGGRGDNLFYSRNIGIADQTLLKIYGGARLTGRIGKWDVGFLDMQTEKSDTIPSEYFGVARIRRQVFNQNSYVGAIVTSRVGMNGTHNIAYGLDGIFRVFKDDYLNLKWAQTYDSRTGNSLSSLNSSFIYFDWERRSEKGLAYRMNYIRAGEQFNPGAGFLMRGGVQGINGQLLYGWLPGEESKLFSYSVSVRGEYFTRLEDGTVEAMNIEPGFRLTTKKGYRADASLEFRQEGVIEDFEISDSITIKAGDYMFKNLQFRFGTPQSRFLSVMGNVDAGQFFDGFKLTLRPSFNFNFSSSLKLMANYELNAIRFPDRTAYNKLNIHLINTSLTYMLSTKLSATLLVQYVNISDELIANFRLRYNPREGNDLYLVINDYQGFDRFSEIPNKPPYFNRTIVIKYTHTFIL